MRGFRTVKLSQMRWLPILLLLSVPLLAEVPDPESAALDEAILRFHRQELHRAEALLLEIQGRQPGNAEAAYYLGRVYLAQGRSLEAVKILEQATRLDPSSADSQFWLARALVQRIGEVPALFKLGIANRMRAAYEKAVELDPDHLEARVAVARYHSEAPPIAGGNPARAGQEIDEIRRRDPAVAHVARGLIHEQLGRPEPAAEELATAVEADPESVVAWREAGLFYQRRQRWADAQRAFDEVLANEPADPVALYEAARTAIAISERQLERAEEALHSYLRLAPGPAPVVLSEGESPRRSIARQQLESVYALQRRPSVVGEEAVAASPDTADQAGDLPTWPALTGCPLVDGTRAY